MDVQSGARQRFIAAINVVPLIDILLVLLIIFMVISPLQPVGLSAQIPQPAAASVPSPDGAVVVSVLARDTLRINQESVSWQDLGSRLEAIFGPRADRVAFLQGADAVDFADVARALDIMRASGIDRVGLVSGDLKYAR